MKYKKICLSILLCFVLYLFFGIVLFLSQRNLLYYPTAQNFKSCEAFQDYEMLNYQGTRFYFTQNIKNPENVLVVYHGNAGSACDRAYLKPLFEDSDYSILFVEYSGYSNDDEKASRDLILRDVENIDEFIQERGFKNSAVYGESLGTGPASYQAFLGNVDQLILVSPFSTLEKLIQSKYLIYPIFILLKENYDNEKWLENFKEKLLIIHGDSDTLIPYQFSKALFEKIPSKNKEYLLIPGEGHGLINDPDLFKEKIVKWLGSH